MHLEGGDLTNESARHFLNQRGWTEKDSFRVYVLDLEQTAQKERLFQDYRRFFSTVAAVLPLDLCGVLEDRFVLLANDSKMPDDRRRKALEELLECDLADPYTRSYMRMSFLLLERHAGLTSPPAAAFGGPEEQKAP